MTRQCELLGLCRSSYYYQPATESPLNLELMQIIDEQHLKLPFYGVPRMTHLLINMGYPVNHKRIEGLMHLLQIQTIYPKKNLSKPDAGHQKFPYLLRGLYINLIWQDFSGQIITQLFDKRLHRLLDSSIL